MNTDDTHLLQQFAAYMRAQNLAENTIRSRTSTLRSLAAKHGALRDLTGHELRLYIGRAGVAAGTRRAERYALTAFYTFLRTEGIRPDNPADMLPHVHVPKGQPRPFTWRQIERMLTSGAYRRTRVMILLGYYQGFRVSTIARVHGSDIDLDEMTIRVIGKGGKQRTLPLHPVIAGIALTMPRDDWWFPARKGQPGPIKPSSVTDLITKAKLRAGITDPTLTPHSLRHGFGTDLVDEGVDIRVIRELMMHETLSSTEIYTQVSARLKREALYALPARPVPERSGRKPSREATSRLAA